MNVKAGGWSRLNFAGVLGHAPLPDDAQCPSCSWFDVSHPGLRQVLRDRCHGDEKALGLLLYQAQCKCHFAEEKRRAAEGLRWEQANLPRGHPKCFASFKPAPGTDVMLEAARDFAAHIDVHCLVLTGPVGVGKSHMLEAICRARLDQGRTARYELVSSFLDRLRTTYSDTNRQEDVSELLAWYERRDVLALDDLGLEKGTEWAIEKLVTVVDERLRNQRDLVVATNRGSEEMRRYSDRLASRLFGDNLALGAVRVVTVDTLDYRQSRV